MRCFGWIRLIDDLSASVISQIGKWMTIFLRFRGNVSKRQKNGLRERYEKQTRCKNLVKGGAGGRFRPPAPPRPRIRRI